MRSRRWKYRPYDCEIIILLEWYLPCPIKLDDQYMTSAFENYHVLRFIILIYMGRAIIQSVYAADEVIISG